MSESTPLRVRVARTGGQAPARIRDSTECRYGPARPAGAPKCWNREREHSCPPACTSNCRKDMKRKCGPAAVWPTSMADRAQCAGHHRRRLTGVRLVSCSSTSGKRHLPLNRASALPNLWSPLTPVWNGLPLKTLLNSPSPKGARVGLATPEPHEPHHTHGWPGEPVAPPYPHRTQTAGARCGKPIVQHLVEDLAAMSPRPFDNIAFVIGDFGEAVEADLLALAPSWAPKATSVTKTSPWAPPMRCGAPKNLLEGETVVAFADTLFRADFPAGCGRRWPPVCEAHRRPPSIWGGRTRRTEPLSEYAEKPEDSRFRLGHDRHLSLPGRRCTAPGN